jgi:hypothetical protein
MKVQSPKKQLVTSNYIGRYFGVIPYAYAQVGSVVKKAVFEFTPKHAVNRGIRYLNK